MSEEELVESGTFRVDPKVAAEKLRDYQLPNAEDFLVPWLRAAVSFGAARVDADSAPHGLRFTFDGSAPDPAVLKDLTAGLLQQDYGEASRHLAFGALALQRLQPEEVSAQTQGRHTVLGVRWGQGEDRAPAALKRLRAAYGMTSVSLFIDGAPVDDPSKAGVVVKAWDGAKTKVVVVEDALAPEEGRLLLYKLGALAEASVFDLGGHYTAFVSNPRVVLSLSQSSVIKDRRYDKTVDRLRRLRRKLLRREPSMPSKVRTWATRGAAIVSGGVALWLAFRFL